MQFEDIVLKTNVLAFASRSKAKGKPQRRTLSQLMHVQGLYPPGTESALISSHNIIRLSLSQCQYNCVFFFVMKIYLERKRWSDWILEIEGLSSDALSTLSDEKWKSTITRDAGNRKRFQYCTDSSGREILYLRPLQGHSGRNLIDPSLKDNVLILNDFFEYIFIISNSGFIPGGQNLSKRQTILFTLVDLLNKEHRDADKIDLEAPRLAWYHQKNVEETSKPDVLGWHQNCSKRFKFHQTRSNAINLYDTLPAYCIPNIIIIGTGESYTRKYMRVFASPRPPNFFSKKIGDHNWVQKFLDEVDFQQVHVKIKSPVVRTRRPVKSEESFGSLTQEIDKGVLFVCESINKTRGVVCQCLLNV